MKWRQHRRALVVSLGSRPLPPGPGPCVGPAVPPVFVELGQQSADREEKEASKVGADAGGLSVEPSAAAAMLAQGFVGEVEPNGSVATATPLPGPVAVGWGAIWPYSDIDYWSFTASAGDRVFAATMTSSSAGSLDSELTLIASDGVTVLELDNDDGSLGSTSSSIAGKLIPASGTYYLKVRYPGTGTTNSSAIRPYHLHLRSAAGRRRPRSKPTTLRPPPTRSPRTG